MNTSRVRVRQVSNRPRRSRRWAWLFRAAAAMGALIIAAPATVLAAPLIVISITGGSPQNICDTGSLVDCITVTDGDLIMCKPTSFGVDGEITGCDWSVFFDGDDAMVDDDLELNQQLRALEITPNGSLVFVVAGNDAIPGFTGSLQSKDAAVFSPIDVFKPYVGGGPYVSSDGVFKLYLDGELTQQDVSAQPWDALEVLGSELTPANQCEVSVDANNNTNRTCSSLGSLTGGSGSGNFEGTIGGAARDIEFANEDLLRCRPTGWFTDGSIQACDYAVMLDASELNGGGSFGITSDIEAINFTSFNSTTMTGQMVFQKKSGTPDGFPAHEPGRDLLVYDGSFGSGECVPSGDPCAGDSDCPALETCDTGSCSITATPCGTNQDCTGGSDVCTLTRPYTATITLFFDGSEVGLSGVAQRIEAFSIVPDLDDDGLPDGIDNCPNADNPPSECSGPGSETCPMGLSSECPMGETCEQPDDDGDGVGDPCDQCNGRPDPGTCLLSPSPGCPIECACGDGILDFPSEDCDLNGSNGPPGPCSLTCQITGTCTVSGTPCTTAGDCPLAPNEGCCGDTDLDAPFEECDDGNAINDDACDNDCQDNPFGTPLIGCDDVTGPHVVPAFAKVTKLKDSGDPAPDLNRWKAVGDANFVAGVTIDPDTEPVTITFNNNFSGVIFQKTLPAGNFSQLDPKLKWKFFNKAANIVPGWRKGKFTQRNNKAKFVLDGRNITVATVLQLDNPAGFRQTVRVGDVCMTTIITCEVKGGGKTVKCPP